jgi:DNA polymerase-3 subunit delta'
LPQIAVEECANIQHKLLLRTALGKFKILIMWQGEYMNNAAANKLLKLIEEPPEKTLIFLTCSNSDQLPATILSRTQVVRVPVPEVKEVDEWLGKYGGVSRDKCEPIAAFCQGNISLACQLASNEELLSQHFEHFVKMMRAAYSAVPIELMDVSELLAGMEREQQKDFLIYSLRMVRECLLQNYLGDKLTHLMPNENAFLNKFAKFINNQNIDGLIADFNEAHVHLTRNANPKILFTDLMIRLTKLIKKSN